MTRENAVALSAHADTAGNKPVWIQIAKTGQWAGHPSGPFQLTPKEFGEIVSSFRATTNRRLPIDFEHASEVDPSKGSIPFTGAPAQGWMIDLDNRGGGGLWALVEWHEPARTYIREGKYRFFSPTIRFNSPDPKSGKRGCRLSSGALTNQPFLDGMMPIAAKDAATESKDEANMTTTNTDPNSVEGLTERVRAGDASIVQLVDKLVEERGCGRDAAFAMAERLAGGYVDPSSLRGRAVVALGRAMDVERAGAENLSIVQLVNKIQAENPHVGRDDAFVRAERILRGAVR